MAELDGEWVDLSHKIKPKYPKDKKKELAHAKNEDEAKQEEE